MVNRIFISSVMREFGEERAAAKEAVVLLRQHPVMAEDFGAQPHSSQIACMDGVGSSQIYVGIFGPRYGYVAPNSGKAATEEEFEEARRRGLPILCFEKIGDKEPEQKKFLDRIKNYESGYSFAFFNTPEELKMKVVQAIHDHINRPGVSTLDTSGSITALDRHQWGSRRPMQYATWLGMVLLPSLQGESFLDVLEFSRPEFQRKLLQQAYFGASPLFSTEYATRTAEEGDALVFRQEENHRQTRSALEIHTDGTLVFGTAMTRDESVLSMARSYVIDAEEVERRLGDFAAYGGQFYQYLERNELISALYFGASLTGINQKNFGKLPSRPVTSISIPMHSIADPIKVPATPLRIPRADLSNPSAFASKVTEHFSRIFRQANAYFTPER